MMVTKTGSHHVLYVCKPCEHAACRVAAAFFAVPRCVYCVRVRTACPPARERRPPVVWGSMWAMWGVGASTGSGRCERVV